MGSRPTFQFWNLLEPPHGDHEGVGIVGKCIQGFQVRQTDIGSALGAAWVHLNAQNWDREFLPNLSH
jgi:hypothetical protein